MFFRSRGEVLLSFGESFGLTEQDTLGSKLYSNYASMTLVGRNKLIKAQILRFSMNTLKMHHSNIRKYSRYISGDILPIDTGTLHSFLLEEAENGRSFISIESCLNSLRFISNFLGYEIIENAALKNLLLFLKKLCPKKSIPKRIGFQKKHILDLKDSIREIGGNEKLSVLQRRSYALLVFCYCSLARFDCARYIKLNNLKFNADYIEVLVERSKTDQAGEGQTMYMLNLPGFNAVKLLANYVFLMDLEGDDYLFPSLKWNKIEKIWCPDARKSISYSAAYSGQKALLKKFGFDETCFSLHSARIGGTTDSFEAGMPPHLIDKRGRWKVPSTKNLYAKPSVDALVKSIKKYM